MATKVWLKDGFTEAAGVLDAILDYAVAELESPHKNNVLLPTLESLITPVLDCDADERKALMKAAGLSSPPPAAFMKVPGWSMGVLREQGGKTKSARANALPQNALWSIAGAGIAGSSGQRARAKRVAGWVHSSFLLSGGRITSDLADLGMLWAMVALATRSAGLANKPGVSALEQFAVKMANQHPVTQVVDQFICCEIARAMGVGKNLPSEHPLLKMPLSAAPRYALNYSPAKKSASGEPDATFRQVPEDLYPYIFFNNKA